jgi:hypothetical protein
MAFPVDFPFGDYSADPPDGVMEEEGVYPSYEGFPFV